jgi:nucleoid-associated protein YgaU
MQKDFKIGMLIGLALVMAAAVWLSLQPGLSVSTRLGQLQDKQRRSQIATAQITGKRENLKTETENKREEIQPQLSQQIALKQRTKQSQALPVNDTKYHTVRSGQTLSEIATEYYGSAKDWTKIRDANPQIDVYKLKPGTTIIIPP